MHGYNNYLRILNGKIMCRRQLKFLWIDTCFVYSTTQKQRPARHTRLLALRHCISVRAHLALTSLHVRACLALASLATHSYARVLCARVYTYVSAFYTQDYTS